MARTPVEVHAARVATAVAPLRQRGAERVPLGDALGRVTASAVVSPLDLPPFRNSQMDGFAARAADLPPRRYRDSGMRWLSDGVAGPADESDERSFCAADPAEAERDLAAFVANLEPDLVISYDPHGGYGHPDHVRVHEITRAVCRSTGVALVEVYPPGRESEAPAGTQWCDWAEHEERAAHALRCYATQLTVHGDGAPYEVEHVGGQREPVVTRLGLSRVTLA